MNSAGCEVNEHEIEAEINSLQMELNNGYDIESNRFQSEVLRLLRELLKLQHNHAYGQYGKHEMP